MSDDADELPLEVVAFDDEMALRKYALETAMAMFGVNGTDDGYSLDDRQRNDCIRCAEVIYAWLMDGFAPGKPEEVKA